MSVCEENQFTRTRARFPKIQIEMSFALREKSVSSSADSTHCDASREKGHISVFFTRKNKQKRKKDRTVNIHTY